MENSARTALQLQISTDRKALILRTRNTEKANAIRDGYEKNAMFSFVDELGRWTVGTDVITVQYLEYKTCKKASYWVHRNGTLLGWGSALHAMALVNDAAGRPVWTAGSEEL